MKKLILYMDVEKEKTCKTCCSDFFFPSISLTLDCICLTPRFYAYPLTPTSAALCHGECSAVREGRDWGRGTMWGSSSYCSNIYFCGSDFHFILPASIIWPFHFNMLHLQRSKMSLYVRVCVVCKHICVCRLKYLCFHFKIHFWACENTMIDLYSLFDCTHVERLYRVFRSCINSSAIKGEFARRISCFLQCHLLVCDVFCLFVEPPIFLLVC